MIIVNFKNYKTGKDVLKLAKKLNKISTRKKIIVCVPAVNIQEVGKKIRLKVYAQHVDYHISEKSTGFILPESIKKLGASGSLLNHSEHKLSLEIIKKTIKKCKKINIKIIACASSLNEVSKLKNFQPFAIAYEDPKLISTGKSITKYRTNDLKRFVLLLNETKIIPLCGAGISSAEDYLAALKIGCKGVLVSSIITKSRNTEKFLKNTS